MEQVIRDVRNVLNNIKINPLPSNADLERAYINVLVNCMKALGRQRLIEKQEQGKAGWWSKDVCSKDLIVGLLEQNLNELRRMKAEEIDINNLRSLVDVMVLSGMLAVRVIQDDRCKMPHTCEFADELADALDFINKSNLDVESFDAFLSEYSTSRSIPKAINFAKSEWDL